jgi:membrane protein DedA with SNARE-associated domain/rhodanese-related sulfurtransferase
MQEIIHLVAVYGLLAVFLNVLLDEAGLPLPSYPLLAVAGALTATTTLSAWGVLGAAVLASAIADNSWYWVSRSHGGRVLGLLCKVSLSPDSCVRQTETMFIRIGPPALLFAKFVPGLGNVAVALFGITQVSPFVFMPLQVASAVIYLGLPVLLGRLFHNAVNDVLSTLAKLGEYGIAVVALALIGYVGIRWYERFTFIRQLRMDRISVEELASLLEDEKTRPLLLDVRSLPTRKRFGIIPGAVAAHPEDVHPSVMDHDRDREIVVYCACPNEASAATAARHLRKAGFKKIRPLLGGVDAWVKSGRSLHTLPDDELKKAA